MKQQTNFYRASCHLCSQTVQPHEGVWDGETFCNQTCVETYFAKLRDQAVAEIAERRAFQRNLIREMAGEIPDRFLVNLLIKATSQRINSMDEIDMASDADLLSILQKMHTRNNRNKANARRKVRPHKSDECRRCGGAGASDRWVNTGSVCFRCYGSGKEPQGA